MAELVDASVSKTDSSNTVPVRFRSRVLLQSEVRSPSPSLKSSSGFRTRTQAQTFFDESSMHELDIRTPRCTHFKSRWAISFCSPCCDGYAYNFLNSTALLRRTFVRCFLAVDIPARWQASIRHSRLIVFVCIHQFVRSNLYTFKKPLLSISLFKAGNYKYETETTINRRVAEYYFWQN